MNEKHLVGALELCDLPQLKLSGLEARVDTGATTSSLHVDNIVKFKKENENWVRFDIHPDSHDVNTTHQSRYVIETDILIAGMQWGIELTLTDRSEMKYLMLLGREAMSGRLIVDPEHEFLLTE